MKDEVKIMSSNNILSIILETTSVFPLMKLNIAIFIMIKNIKFITTKITTIAILPALDKGGHFLESKILPVLT